MTSLVYGKPAPPFALPSTLGREVSLAEYHGRPVVLVFYCYDFGSI